MRNNEYHKQIDKFDDDFGDDFEVRYTEEIPDITWNMDDESDSYSTDNYDEPNACSADCREDRSYADERKVDGRRSRKGPRRVCQNDSASRRPDSRRPSELAAPIQNIVHTGSSLIEKLTRLFFRPAPILMSAVILLITAFTYWIDSAQYGNLLTVIENPESSMVTFLAVGAVVMLWELCCFFFTLSGVWRGNGRGLSFFILVYVLSYVSGLAGEILPEGLAIIDGIRGGLITFGSLYSMIFPFCVIGIVTCMIQKILGR